MGEASLPSLGQNGSGVQQRKLAGSSSTTQDLGSTAQPPLNPRGRTMQKVISLALFILMWLAPQVLHRTGLSSKIGSPTAMPFNLPILYTGTATHANISFFVVYFLLIRYLSSIVSPRHRLRLETASVWIPSVIAMLVFSPFVCYLFMATISYYGVLEFRFVLDDLFCEIEHGDSVSKAKSERKNSFEISAKVACWPVTVPAVLITFASVLGSWSLFGLSIVSSIFGMMLFYPTIYGAEKFHQILLMDLFGLLYVSFCMGIAGMGGHMPHGHGWAFFVISCSWIGDGGAYFIGSRYGKHKCFPQVSPGKSWEGIAAELVWTIVAALIVYGSVAAGAEFLNLAELYVWEVVVAGIIFAIAGITGDLCESLLKRVGDVKDSGNFFPGHGGILDRFDGFFFGMVALSCRHYMATL